MTMNKLNAFYQTNLMALKQTQPDLAIRVDVCSVPADYHVVQAKNSLPVLKVGCVSCHSIYDPAGEGKKFVEKHLSSDGPLPDAAVLVFGFGFAYHFRPLLDRDIPFAVYEPSMATLRLAMEHVDLTAIFSKTRIYASLDEVIPDRRKFRIWPHLPTVKRYSDLFDRLKKTVYAQPLFPDETAVLKDKLKIMVVSPIYGGSLPVAKYCARALEKIGHQVDYFDASIFSVPFEKILHMDIDDGHKKGVYDLFQQLISEMVVATCSREKPDILLALAQAPVSLKALELLRRSGIVTAFWFVEDYRHMPYWKAYAPCYDFYFTIQKDRFFQELDALGVKNYHYLPMAADPEVHCPLSLSEAEKMEYGSDLSFMGAGYHNRQKIFAKMDYRDFKIWGNSWDPGNGTWRFVQRNGQRVNTREAVKIFNATQINLNLHSYAYDDGINPDGDFVNPRTFEIAACGAFQLVDQRGCLPELFREGEEMISFNSEAELFRLIDMYLENPHQRTRICARARQRVLAEHTYEHRMKEMVSFIREKRPEKFIVRKPERLRIHDREAFVCRFPETQDLFNSIPEKTGALELEMIKNIIKSGEGDLTYPAAIFLLMDEFQKFFEERVP